ncbi:MAG: TonB family protein [Pyrinomonadaceae bacterium]
MGKIVKYCAECEEGFAEKFSFCPNCASSLTAYEMNPAVPGEVLKVAEPVEETKNVPAETVQNAPVAAQATEPVTQNLSPTDDEELDLFNDDATSDDEIVSEPVKEKAEVFAPAVAASSYVRNFSHSPENYLTDNAQNGNGSANGHQADVAANSGVKTQDGLYHITLVEEKNASGRNLLLLGAFLLVTTTVFGAILYSLFKQNPYIGSLNDNDVVVAYADPNEAPDEVKTEKPEAVKKDNGGGGGGGGKENPEPATKGRQPTQVENPIQPPQPLPQVTNASLPNLEETQGKIKRDRTTEPVGLANGLQNTDNLSSGNGRGGGIGNGNGTGIGSGGGTGEGSGIGSGSGGGRGNGYGNGTGDGAEGIPKMPVKPPPPVVEPFKILSKPRANYTDTARQNQVTGVVRVRVVFLPSGSIGSVTPMNTLPYGLTDQAIAAAKQIRFEPQKSNGVPVPVTKVIEYSFSIY